MKIVLIGLTIMLITCTSEDLSVFNETYTDKDALRNNGYAKIKIDPEGYIDDWYRKRVGDTIVEYIFNDETLSKKNIILTLVKIDTNLLFQHLDKLDYKLIEGKGHFVRTAIIHRKTGRKYYIHRNSKELIFSEIYSENKTVRKDSIR